MMNNFSFVLIASLIYLNEVFCGYGDFGSLMGNEKEGRIPQIIFINYGDVFPTEPYPHKKNGPTVEISPDERYLLPTYMNYLVFSVITILSVLILFHLLRRRPIEHFEAKEKPIHDRAEEIEIELAALMKDRKADHAKFFYTRRTNHVATSQKLRATFERDFDATIHGMSDEEYAQKATGIIETVKMGGIQIEDED